MEKKLKVVLIVLVMVLIILIAFGGIYTKKLISYNNILPDYELGLKLKGSRVTTLILNEDTNEIIRDAEGNVVNEIPEGADENNYKKEKVAINSDENKTKENYKKAKQIITGRLESLNISNYEVRLDEESGRIYIELAETEKTETILTNLLQSGKFEIVDKDDGTVLMTNDDIESAKVAYNSVSTGISVYLDIKFNKEGKKKINQISKDYTEIETTENSEGTEDSAKQKEITMKISGQEFLTTHFDEEVTNGELTISIGNASTDGNNISEYVEQAQYYATVLSNGELPLTYEIENSEYIQSVYSNTIYKYILLGMVALTVLISIVYMIIKYKKLGLLSSIVYIATAAFLLILIRYTKAEITLDTIVFSILLVLINTYVNCKVLKNLDKSDSKEERKGKIYNAYLKLVDILIVTLIPSVIFTYNSSSEISSIGTVLFWGVIGIVLMNVLFTRTLLIEK